MVPHSKKSNSNHTNQTQTQDVLGPLLCNSLYNYTSIYFKNCYLLTERCVSVCVCMYIMVITSYRVRMVKERTLVLFVIQI